MQKSFIKSFVLTAVTALAVLLSPTAHAQGVVSGGIAGTLIDNTGKAVSGATVTVVHVPTNSTYTAQTGSNGRFSVTGLRVGGPYTVSASATGYNVEPLQDVETGLGEDTDVLLKAKTEVLQLEKFVTTAEKTDLDGNATGAGSVLSNRGIQTQPTSNRSFADMMKTNPFVTIRAFPQVSALGMNNRYNSITLDGARLNDQFGLSSSGLFSLKNPFSLDAVENFSITLTPYDVTQSNFAGASINVVSKSGTNEFHGSTYYIYTSDHWQGKDLSGTNIGKRPAAFWERTWGATLGGPIWKNKLFFFLNYEKVSNPSLGPTSAGFTPDTAAMANIDAQVKALPGAPNLGSFGGAANLTKDEKRLIKIDWNISQNHRLTARYSRTLGNQAFFPNFIATGLSTPLPAGVSASGYTNGVTSYTSNFYTLAVDEKVWASQLFSTWTPDLKTQFSFSKNDTTSLRSTPINFPEIVILNVPGTSSTGTAISTNDALVLGTDVSSMGNGVVSNEVSFAGNAEYLWNNVTFKAGFDHEKTDFENLFRAGSYGVFGYNYSPTLNLSNDLPIAFVRGVASSGFPGTDISQLEQTGYFVQAKWQPTSRFNLTLGVRYDVLGSPIAPSANATFASAFGTLYPGIRNDGTIDGTSRAAPRISFNYSVDQERKMQVRGGLGVFLGRNPWVWISNSYGNAGFGRFNVTNSGATSPTLAQYLGGTFSNTDSAYKFDPANPLGVTNISPAASSPAVNFIQPGLKLPTNLRGNLALDIKLPKINSVFSVEYIHSSVMEALFYDNLNLKVLNGDAANKPTATSYGADGRLRFATNAAGTSAGAANAPLVTGWQNILRLSNTGVGHSDYVAFMLDRPFKNGWAANAVYTRGRATEAQPAGSSTAGSQWNFNEVFNQNTVEESRSDYEIRDRVQLTLTKEFNYFKYAKTAITLYYEGRTGQPFSYVYGGASAFASDLNKDGNANDLVAVPTNATDSRFDFSSMTSAQQDAYFAFLNSSGLSKYAGGYAPRNAFTTVWQNRLDLHVSQEIKTKWGVHTEVFADFVNFGNWLNKSMFNYIEEINTATSNSNQNRAFGAATYGTDGRIKPTLTLNSDGSVNFPATSTIVPNNGDSRWRIVAGVRVKF